MRQWPDCSPEFDRFRLRSGSRRASFRKACERVPHGARRNNYHILHGQEAGISLRDVSVGASRIGWRPQNSKHSDAFGYRTQSALFSHIGKALQRNVELAVIELIRRFELNEFCITSGDGELIHQAMILTVSDQTFG